METTVDSNLSVAYHTIYAYGQIASAIPASPTDTPGTPGAANAIRTAKPAKTKSGNVLPDFVEELDGVLHAPVEGMRPANP